jgi:hypothetical protein
MIAITTSSSTNVKAYRLAFLRRLRLITRTPSRKDKKGTFNEYDGTSHRHERVYDRPKYKHPPFVKISRGELLIRWLRLTKSLALLRRLAACAIQSRFPTRSSLLHANRLQA